MSTYNEVLNQVETLTPEEQLKLLEELTLLVRRRTISTSEPISPSESNCDSLIGLFSGDILLATQSEEILEQELNKISGWTWK